MRVAGPLGSLIRFTGVNSRVECQTAQCERSSSSPNQCLRCTAGSLLNGRPLVRPCPVQGGVNVRADSANSRALASADGSSDRAAGVDSALAAHAVGLLLRPGAVVARRREVPLPALPGSARGRRRLLLAAAIFSYTLMPTVTELLADLVGGDSTPRFTGAILYFFLLLLVMGSFACVQTLMDAVRKREWKFIVQMVVVELFVMFFEVIFLYRELIDALTPWISQQTGMKLGLTVTLLLSSFGWIGIRGMTWFLFGQFGTAR